MERARQTIRERVALFREEGARYCSAASGYTETEARVEFIDPLFACLGWDMANALRVPNSLKDVIREESQVTETSAKRPDYTFRVAAVRKFFVEAKKPSVDIRTSRDSAFQIRSYGWTAGLPVSVLTNFRTLRIYDTRSAPAATDHADTGLLLEVACEEFDARFEELFALFGREAVAEGSLETAFGATGGGIQIEEAFLERFNAWRLKIANDLVSRYPMLGIDALNDLAQKVINRVVFVRMCEDRGIEGERRLRQVAERQDVVELRRFFREMDDRYNTGLFDVAGDQLQTRYALSSSVFLEIVEDLYFPKAPYSFSVLDADFLGQIYELFLVKRLVASPDGGGVILKDKPAYEGREIVTTPQTLVDEIVRRTFAGRLAAPATIEELRALRVLDIAVGSSRFLLRALDALVDAAIAHFRRAGDTANIYRRAENDYRLRFEAKLDLLRSCLYGIDIDYSAVEVARFSLLVKLLEDETHETLPPGRKILPHLDRNIVWGNSLVGTDFSGEDEQAVPLDWAAAGLPEAFDAVIGNPPYVKTEEMKCKTPGEFAYYKARYVTPFKQFDKYFLFVEKAVSVLQEGGWAGMVVSSKWITIGAGQKLRSLLAGRGLAAEIVDFGNERVFEGKSAYTCLLVLSMAPREDVWYRRVHDRREWLANPAAKGMRLASTLIRQFGADPWVMPATEVEAVVLAGLYANSVRLREIADVVNGIQTSAEDVFPIRDWTETDELVRFEQNGGIWTIEKAITRPYLMDSTRYVHSYTPVTADALIIFPYEYGENGEAILIPPARMEGEFPRAWEYLRRFRDRLERRSVSPSPVPGEFYRYGRHQALSSAFRPHKIIYTVNQRGDKYGIDETGVGFASGGTAGEVAITAPRGGYSLEFILALLNQRVAEFFLRKRGSPFGGGYYGRGTAVVSDLPVPRIDFTNPVEVEIHRRVTALVRRIISVQASLASAVGRERERLERDSGVLSRRVSQEFERLWDFGGQERLLHLPGEHS